ncbi:hypothetical protein AMC85_PD00837 (plasmid) [Rhizobium phaseoli]|nr:hypothetical protein AMC88_PD00836 [Rhizobium phaseoli]ANL63642.1 hypothetical protein AMC85_PD00837 [Rhizobium phaseoli]
MNTLSTNTRPTVSGFKVDISRGERIGRVSSEWFSRPDDERFMSLTELYDTVRSRADRAHARTIESAAIRVEATRDNAERLELLVPGERQPIAPTHWSYGQLCSLVGAPATYMRQLPAPLAAINLQHGLLNHRAQRPYSADRRWRNFIIRSLQACWKKRAPESSVRSMLARRNLDYPTRFSRWLQRRAFRKQT